MSPISVRTTVEAVLRRLRAEDRALDEVGGADEVGHELVRRPLVDVARAADLLDAPFVHHRDLVRQRQRLALVVRHVDRGDLQLALQPLQLEAHLLAQLRVEVGQRLVEQEQRRLHHQRARQRQALLLAAGELRRLALGEMIELHRREHAHHVVANLLPRVTPAAHFERKRRVLKHVHVRPDGVGLEHHAEAAAVRAHEEPRDDE